MLPLGDFHRGLCLSTIEPFTPEGFHVQQLCNLGYARGQCPRFPADADVDAVRFTIARDDGTAIHLRFVLERGHHPHAHGPLEYRRDVGGFAEKPEGPLAAQATAYIASYLRRKAEAS